ncbi:MAG: FAD-dependent oxidoreductase, partial [Chitinivibrionales bacterium]
GAGTPRDLNIQGRHLKGIHFAMDYLIPSNLYVDGDTGRDKMISAEGRNVLVIGGGDTGSDCVGTAVRQGAKKVYQFEIMPKPMEWNSSYNPEWPHYPKILRTSTSHEEGCERDWNIQTESFEGDDRVKRVNFSRIRWEKDDQGSRPKPERITRSDFSLDIDLVLLAAGFLHVEHSNLIHDFGIELDKRGNIQGDSEYSTSIPGIYTAGDSNTGASLVIRAMYHGRKAAESMISFLRNARP